MKRKSFESLEGKLLVASPHVTDPHFERSVVYICVHDDDDVIGVVVNHCIGRILENELKEYLRALDKNFTNKSTQDIKDIAPKKTVRKKNYPVLLGGPAYTERVVVLSLNKEQEKKFAEEQALTLYTDLSSFLKEYNKGKTAKLLFAKGLAVWHYQQLEQEIKNSDWILLPASLEILFAQKIQHKWEYLIKNIGISHLHNFVSYAGEV